MRGISRRGRVMPSSANSRSNAASLVSFIAWLQTNYTAAPQCERLFHNRLQLRNAHVFRQLRQALEPVSAGEYTGHLFRNFNLSKIMRVANEVLAIFVVIIQAVKQRFVEFAFVRPFGTRIRRLQRA